MQINETTRKILVDRHETGMGFQLVLTLNQSIYAVFNGSRVFEITNSLLDLPTIEEELGDEEYIDVKDVLKIGSLPLFTQTGIVNPGYLGVPASFPLIKEYTLQSPTIFYRIIAHGPADFRYNNGQLSPNTYLTTILDKGYANTGFAVVGRYALPVPLPGRYCIEYEVPAGTVIKSGTVAPNFGQAGGGVEVLLTSKTKVTKRGYQLLSDY
ncbi:hypothetical protein SanaruYs_37480 [Chryseotalea sanaruensis]|uniref:Uncharacterized protein n=1 Tax=Chryseotalea sanaruensis TaxID=2482724 RepID=A0A401UF35_9BACT|nr:hypothetical protein [Chryseotalea sanaruensis]GCC53503.1 hypothetical protein SanaruYs_37480 [Chryseotalea sanaruensis]